MKRTLAHLLTAGLLAAPGAAQDEAREQGYWERAKKAFDFEGFDRKRAMEEAQRLYQQAKAAGEKVPADLLEWAREDLARAGRWEYKVVEVDADPGEMESRLNAHGQERWECVSAAREKKKWVVVLKRPVASRLQRYFGHLGASDILRLLGG